LFATFYQQGLQTAGATKEEHEAFTCIANRYQAAQTARCNQIG